MPVYNQLILGSSWNLNPLHHWRVNQMNMTVEITGTQIIYLSIIPRKHKRSMVVKLHACDTVSWLVRTGACILMHCSHIKASHALWTNHRKQLHICAAKSSHRPLRLLAELTHTQNTHKCTHTHTHTHTYECTHNTHTHMHTHTHTHTNACTHTHTHILNTTQTNHSQIMAYLKPSPLYLTHF